MITTTKHSIYQIKEVQYYSKEDTSDFSYKHLLWNTKKAYLPLSMYDVCYRDKEHLEPLLAWVSEKITSCDVIVGDFIEWDNPENTDELAIITRNIVLEYEEEYNGYCCTDRQRNHPGQKDSADDIEIESTYTTS